MNRICRRVALAVSLWAVLVTVSWGAGPRIFKMEPSEGMADRPIRLIGENLSKTRSIQFLVKHVYQTAKFRVVSNSELEVIVPEVFEPDAEALIILQHDDGVILTCPPGEIVVRENSPRIPSRPATDNKVVMIHVIQEGVLEHVHAATVVESGGIVGSVERHCPLLMVKNGGLVGPPESHSSLRHGLLFHEPEVKLSREFLNAKSSWKIIPVRSIQLAEGIGPFVFRSLPVADELKASVAAPQITAITPGAASSGDTITVKGRGFSGASKVFVVCGSAHEAGFKLLSDSVLKVELPESHVHGHAELIVINSKGLALTHSPSLAHRPGPAALRHVTFVHVTPEMVLTDRETMHFGNRPLYLVENGGKIINSSASGVFVVKAGGTIDSNHSKIFCEPGASIPVGRRQADTTEVPAINVNKLHTGLEVIKK